jgi:hypothetical protein
MTLDNLLTPSSPENKATKGEKKKLFSLTTPVTPEEHALVSEASRLSGQTRGSLLITLLRQEGGFFDRLRNFVSEAEGSASEEAEEKKRSRS